jgi:hypothetical protein
LSIIISTLSPQGNQTVTTISNSSAGIVPPISAIGEAAPVSSKSENNAAGATFANYVAPEENVKSVSISDSENGHQTQHIMVNSETAQQRNIAKRPTLDATDDGVILPTDSSKLKAADELTVTGELKATGEQDTIVYPINDGSTNLPGVQVVVATVDV